MSSLDSFMSFALPAAGAVANIVAPGVGGAVASTLGGVLGKYFGNNAQEDQAMRLADKQLSNQKALFDYQSEYNSPANQVKRLEEAGLNPALMYGSGTAVSSNQAMPSTSMPQLSRYSSDAISPEQVANIRQKEAQTELTQEDIAIAKLNKSLMTLDIESKKILNEIALGTKDAKIQMAHEEVSLIQHNILKINAEIDYLFFSAGLSKAQTAKAKAELQSLEISNDIQGYRNQIEKKLGWVGQPCVQRLISIGVDGLTSLVGIGKFLKSFKDPKKIGESVETWTNGPKGLSHTQTTRSTLYE